MWGCHSEIFVGCANDGCIWGCPHCGVSPRSAVRGCIPMMGPALVVRNAEFGGAGLLSVVLVSVDERVAFGRCLPRWENSGVNFCETASYVVRGWAPIVGAGAVVRNAECGPGAELVGPHQSWVHLGLSAMRSLNRARVVVGALLVEYWRSSLSVYAGVLDVRYSTFSAQEASSWLRVLSP